MTKPAGFGTGPVKIGSPMQTVGLQRFKAKQGQTILINPIVNDVWPFLVGYKAGVGMVHYFEETGLRKELADKLPEWTAYYVIPIVVYQEWSHSQKKVVGGALDFQYLRLNEKTYKDVFETYASLNGEDSAVRCRSSTPWSYQR